MADNQLPFYTQTAVLDTYIKTNTSSPEVVELIAKTLRSKPELYTYFFSNRPHPSWAEALFSHGYFVNAPDPVKTAGGFMLPLWLEQEYLISVANEVPKIVIDHVRNLKGHSFYKNRAIKALQLVPPAMIEDVISTILSWLEITEIGAHSFLETFGLIKTLAENKSESSFLIFEKVTTPSPDPSNKPGDIFYNSAISTFPLDEYFPGEGLTLESIALLLQELNVEKTISILEKQLCEALRIEGEQSRDEGYKSSSFWRNSIEETGQDLNNDYKDKLLIVLRDLLETEAENNPDNIAAIIKRYLADPHEILRRLGLHILSQYPDKFRDSVVRELLKLENMDDVGIHHEYFMLLKNGYPYLGRNEQGQLVNAIILGLSQEKLDRISEWAEIESEKERREYVTVRNKLWIRDRLWMLKDYLEEEPKELLDSLVAEFKKPENPAFTHWTSGAYFVSDITPITKEELRQKSSKELLDYLKNWKPPKDNYGPERESYGALGEQVANLILSDLERYKPVVKEIVPIHSGFATALLHALAPENESFQAALDLILDICEHLLANDQTRTSMEELPSGRWVYFRFSAVGKFEKIITDSKVELPERQWIRIRDLLVLLSDDPDPDLENDRPSEGWFGHNDPLTVAINHVRPEAILSLIYYANKVAVKKLQHNKENTTRELEPAVKGVLTSKVKRKKDFSLAVHSVFGRELNRLYWIDKKWVEDHIDEIFPVDSDEESIAFYVAAWDSYVSNHRIDLELFELLRPRYERAIENISKGYITKTFNPVNAISHHLLLEYQLAKYHINSPEGQNSLIAKFFHKCLPGQRGEAVWALSQRTHKNPQDWQRAKELWIWRAEVASSENYNSDFKSEMASFSHLLLAAPETENVTTLWSLLESLLPYIGDSKGWNRIWQNLQKYLAKEAERDPVGVIRFYNIMHDQLNKPRPSYEYHKEGRKILEAGAANKNSRDDTLLLIDKLSRSGNYQFRDIQERILSPN